MGERGQGGCDRWASTPAASGHQRAHQDSTPCWVHGPAAPGSSGCCPIELVRLCMHAHTRARTHGLFRSNCVASKLIFLERTEETAVLEEPRFLCTHTGDCDSPELATGARPCVEIPKGLPGQLQLQLGRDCFHLVTRGAESPGLRGGRSWCDLAVILWLTLPALASTPFVWKTFRPQNSCWAWRPCGRRTTPSNATVTCPQGVNTTR